MLTKVAIMTALGRDARKQVERGLSCSRSQAWRMVYHGQVPGKFRAALIGLLEEAIRRNQEKLREIEGQLREIAMEEMAARAAARRSAGATAAPRMVEGQTDRAT